jgi:valyl-tRNA synthetase
MSTPFPSPIDAAYDPKAIEPAARELWERERCHAFDAEAARRAPQNVFSIDTPPPTVSGSLHIGHVFSYTQAECIARYQRMRGRNVFYPFGFDGNGLPTERLAEQEHNVKGRDMPRPQFVKLCLETSRKYEAEFEQFMRSLGISADWSLAYSTIDERCMRISQRGFLDLWNKGEAYLKDAPTFWCTQCGTALAQADLEAKEKPSQFLTVRFDLEGGGHFEIATTRPELMPACVAVFLHPSHPRASELVGRRALVPLQSGYSVPIMKDEKVDPEKGTGIVMCCTFGDKTDVEWFRKHALPLRVAIARDGTMTELAGPEKGLYVNKARRQFADRLAAAGHLVTSKEIVHPVATHERCKTDVQFLSTKQVFIRLLDKKAELLAMGEKVRWLPDYMGKRYRDWVENLEWDWGVSRQRHYGVPFPMWHCKRCGTPTVARDEDLPVDPTATPPKTPCPSCGSTEFDGDRDVMDTWATSSETPQINAKWGEKDPVSGLRPMSMRPQAHEIIRTWAFYTIAKSWLHWKEAPWRDAMISGWVLAPDREKISKSKGNAPADPRMLIEKHGADSLRYWALSAKLGTDYAFNEEDIASGRRLCMKLWNAGKLLLGHLAGFDPKAARPPERPVDRGMRLRLARAAAEATELLDAYEFGLAKKRVEELFWGDLCDHWLEMAKDRLYDASPAAAETRRATQATAHDVLYGILRLLAPFTPHVVEALHQAHFRATDGPASITRAPWPTASKPSDDDPGLLAWNAAVVALAAIRRWRSESKVSPAKAIPRARLMLPSAAFDRFSEVEADVRAAGRVSVLEAARGPESLVAATLEILEAPLP